MDLLKYVAALWHYISVVSLKTPFESILGRIIHLTTVVSLLDTRYSIGYSWFKNVMEREFILLHEFAYEG